MDKQSRNKEQEDNNKLSSNSTNEPMPVYLPDDSPAENSEEIREVKISDSRINKDDEQDSNDNTLKKSIKKE